jgi:hypothetical protein
MFDQDSSNAVSNVIATIRNNRDPEQSVTVSYHADEKAFVTSGIEPFFGAREILIPGHLAVIDFELMGAIVSSILEKLSQARDMGLKFAYAPRFSVFDKMFTLTEYGKYMRLTAEEFES